MGTSVVSFVLHGKLSLSLNSNKKKTHIWEMSCNFKCFVPHCSNISYCIVETVKPGLHSEVQRDQDHFFLYLCTLTMLLADSADNKLMIFFLFFLENRI